LLQCVCQITDYLFFFVPSFVQNYSCRVFLYTSSRPSNRKEVIVSPSHFQSIYISLTPCICLSLHARSRSRTFAMLKLENSSVIYSHLKGSWKEYINFLTMSELIRNCHYLVQTWKNESERRKNYALIVSSSTSYPEVKLSEARSIAINVAFTIIYI
jgi:hypothetical protein